MYLKALEIQGFKSFPDKTVLTFDKDITAIVGPNGSGKSNISDALLWVMGEQRSKALRGGKMEDVVFGGTEKRSPMGFAQVSLILDNSRGTFNIDAPELIITRRYYRSGESEYYINRESVRLKDITALLMDTGLGRDGYSIIGQGRIAEIVSAKSLDRREIFEEAAGISRFRYRKEEAERKLGHTEENLLRINDKIGELELQVGPLEKQAETAKQYLLLRDEQRGLEISVWMETLDRLHVQSQEASENYEQSRAKLDGAQSELQQLYAAAESISERMRECDLEAETERGLQSGCESAAAECESAAAVLQANLSHNAETAERMRAEMDEQAGRTEALRSQAEDQRSRIDEIGALLEQRRREIEEILEQSRANAEEEDKSQLGLDALAVRENETADAITKCVTTISLLQDKKTDLQKRGGGIDADIEGAETKYDEVCALLHAAEKDYSDAKDKADALNNVVNGHKMLMGSREKAVSDLTERHNALIVEKRSAESRIHLLSEMEKEYEGMSKAVKNVMQAASRGQLRGVRGPVAGLLHVEERFAVAVETALGAAVQNIVVDTQDDGKAAIELLKRSDGGRATFLPADTIRGGTLQRPPKDEPGYLGLASELARFDARYTNIFENLLGRTVVAESLGDAVRMSRRSDNRLRIVTLDGQMINAGGSMTGGSAARNVGILSRANELKKLKADLVSLEEQERECAQKLTEAQRVLSGAKYDSEVAAAELTEATEALHKRESAVNQNCLLRDTLDETIESLEQEKASLSANQRETDARLQEEQKRKTELELTLASVREEITRASEGREDFQQRRNALNEALNSLREDCASLTAERSAAEHSLASLEELFAALSGDRQQRLDSLAELERQAASLREQLTETQQHAAEHRGEAEKHKSRIAEITAFRMELEGKRTRNDRSAQEKNREILDLQSVCAAFEQKKASAEMEERQIVDKLWENYELSRSAAQAERKPVESMSAATKRITELRRAISRLGAVNVGAIEEYARVKERYDFLSGQRDDVESARRDLLKIISDITGEMKEIFVREFAAIDEGFRKVFLELFGGGKASLVLEDPEQPLECGIEIKVQPPGKAVTTISLLSGGEKSFVAIALYFAIMKVRPTPFCVMDEIDAALDEANVERYAEYMRTMTGGTQFIVITHHRATMEEADVLYGVTMQEKGVTTVLSVDLEEAERTIS